MKIPGLLIEENDDMIQTLFEDVRTSLSMTQQEFVLFLQTEKGQQLFKSYDETIAPKMVDRYTDKIFDQHQEMASRNETVIIKENRELLKAYCAYVHTVHIVYNKVLVYLQKNKPASGIAVKDLVNIVMYGNLCRLADQIGVLMQNGFPDAALMHWRSFYEYGVIGCFLMEKDSEDLSQRFKDASYKEIFKKVDSFNKRNTDLKFPRLDETFIQKTSADYEALKTKYGKTFFKNEYNWAEGFVTGELNFRTIEDAMDFGRYRPFYIWASSRSHPNYYGLTGFFSEKDALVLRNIVVQDIEKRSMIDPAQLTLSVFDQVNKRFLYLYSKGSEYSTNLSMFAELYKRFAANITDTPTK